MLFHFQDYGLNLHCGDCSFYASFIEMTKIKLNSKLFGTVVPLSRAYKRVT